MNQGQGTCSAPAATVDEHSSLRFAHGFIHMINVATVERCGANWNVSIGQPLVSNTALLLYGFEAAARRLLIRPQVNDGLIATLG
jgi:hypothetical protein